VNGLDACGGLSCDSRCLRRRSFGLARSPPPRSIPSRCKLSDALGEKAEFRVGGLRPTRMAPVEDPWISQGSPPPCDISGGKWMMHLSR